MTIGTLTLLAVTGSLVLFKLGLMALAVALLARTLLPTSKALGPPPAPAGIPSQGNAPR